MPGVREFKRCKRSFAVDCKNELKMVDGRDNGRDGVPHKSKARLVLPKAPLVPAKALKPQLVLIF